jgi:hypothetical protein
MPNDLRSYIQRTRQHNIDNPDDQKPLRFSNEGADKNPTTADQYVEPWRPDKDTFTYDEDKFTAETEQQLQTPDTGFDYNENGPPAPQPQKPAGPPEGYQKPDYSLEGRERFQNIIFKEIGGNPFGYDPMEVVNEHMDDQNLEQVFRKAFGGQILYADRDQMDAGQKKHWNQVVQQYRAHVYDQAENKKNMMIEQYNFMMNQFDNRAQSFAAAQEKVEKKIAEAQGSVDKKIETILKARPAKFDENGQEIDQSMVVAIANAKAFDLVAQGEPAPQAVLKAIQYADSVQNSGPLGQILQDMGQPQPGTAQAAPAGWDQAKEAQFRNWYDKTAKAAGLNPDPDDPQHFYDYRSAFAAGVKGPDKTGHWPSEYKTEGHPRMVVDGVNTKTGEPDAELERKRAILFGGQVPGQGAAKKPKLKLDVPKTAKQPKGKAPVAEAPAPKEDIYEDIPKTRADLRVAAGAKDAVKKVGKALTAAGLGLEEWKQAFKWVKDPYEAYNRFVNAVALDPLIDAYSAKGREEARDRLMQHAKQAANES